MHPARRLRKNYICMPTPHWQLGMTSSVTTFPMSPCLCFLVFASVHNPCSWCAFASHETDPSSWHASSCIPAVSLTCTRLNNFFHFREVSVAAACMSLGQVGETVSRTFLFKNIRLPRRRYQDNRDPEQSLVNRAPKARDGHVGRKLTAECEL